MTSRQSRSGVSRCSNPQTRGPEAGRCSEGGASVFRKTDLQLQGLQGGFLGTLVGFHAPSTRASPL